MTVRPTSFSEEEKKEWNGQRVIFKCPPEIENCEPVEVIKGEDFIAIPFVMDQIDLDNLQYGHKLWLVIHSEVMPPISLGVHEDIGDQNKGEGEVQ